MDDNSLVFLLTLTFFVIFPSSLGVLYYVRTYSSFWVTGYCASTEVVKVKGKEPAEDSTNRNPNGPSNEHPKYGLVYDRPNNDRIKALEEYVDYSNRKHNKEIEELKQQQKVLTKENEDLKQQQKLDIRAIKALEERLIQGRKLGQSNNSRKERRDGIVPDEPMN